ncbi:hypothetical protein ACLOJK_009329 [Asimina triloba]
MGNIGSSGNHARRRSSSRRVHDPSPTPQSLPPAPTPTPTQQPPPPPEISGNRYVFAAATPYPPQYPTPNPPPYYPYSGYYHPPPPVPMPAPFDHRGGPHLDSPHPNWVGGRYPCGPVPPAPPPFVEYQKAVTIRNDVNIKKETLRVEPDEENPGKYLVAFTFDATVAGSVHEMELYDPWLGKRLHAGHALCTNTQTAGTHADRREKGPKQYRYQTVFNLGSGKVCESDWFFTAQIVGQVMLLNLGTGVGSWVMSATDGDGLKSVEQLVVSQHEDPALVPLVG